jgi:hypothetical protein
MQNRFFLQPYNGPASRYRCPQCKQNRKFTYYIDRNTNEPISPIVGRCDRELSCGYHLTPKQFFADEGINPKVNYPIGYPIKKDVKANNLIKISEISQEQLIESLGNYKQNNFSQFLITKFGNVASKEVIKKYFIGTSNHWKGATIFWQVSSEKLVIRTGKVMLYDQVSGKRIKTPFNHINWIHNISKIQNFSLCQCLFGEHLLSEELAKPIGIVESEKTAIISSLYFPQFIWLATGGLSINPSLFSCLKGRQVVLFPDVKGFDTWRNLSAEISKIASVKISDLLEKGATEKEQGYDLADYLLKFDLNKFTGKNEKLHLLEKSVEINNPLITNFSVDLPETSTNNLPWDDEIKHLENYFSTINLTSNIQLDSCTKILDVEQFISSHLMTIKSNNGKRNFLPYLHRLRSLKKYFQQMN